MKKYVILIVSAILGSSLTIAVFMSFGMLSDKTVKIEHIDNPGGTNVVYRMNKNGEIAPLDFKEASRNVMPAVVHIRSTKTTQPQLNVYQRGHSNDPFRHFFQDDLFDHFFGPQFRYQSPQQHQRKPQVQVGTGSGVIFSENGYIVTNNHVIENADDIEITLYDDRSFKATVVGTDPSTDLAVLQIKEKNLPIIPLTDSDKIEVGDWVLAVGNPFNLNSTVTAGIVSAKGRNINILKDKSAIESFIQTDAAINPGNSGGALVDLNGGLVGINTAIASPTGAYSGYGFAVPANIVEKVVSDLIKYGVVQRGYLGVMILKMDAQLAEEKELDVSGGVYVDSLLENSAAADAGLKVGDVILEVNNLKVKSAPELQEIVGRQSPGDKVALKINRKGKEKELSVILKNQDGNHEIKEKESIALLNRLGADFETLDRKTAKKLDLEGGVRIKQLHAGKLKRSTNIREGFIITKIAGRQIQTVDDLVLELEKLKGGVMIEGVYEDYPGVHYYAFGM